MKYSPSRQKTFNRCKRLFYYNYILGYRETKKAPWLIYGTNIDKLLEIYDLSGIEGAIKAIPKYFINEYDRIDAKILLTHFHEKLGSTPLPPIEVEGQPGNQFKFNLKLRPPFMSDCDIEILGFLDKVCSHSNRTAFVERKTTSQNISYTAPYWNGLSMDKQIVCYSYALSSIIEGQVNQCFYEVLRKPNTSLCSCFSRVHTSGKDKQKTKTIIEYINGIEAAKDKWTKKDMVVRKPIWITQDQRDEWMMDLIADDDQVKTMELNQKELETQGFDGMYAWPRNQHGCDAYGGCPYQDVCEGKCTIDQLTTIVQGV